MEKTDIINTKIIEAFDIMREVLAEKLKRKEFIINLRGLKNENQRKRHAFRGYVDWIL